MTDAKGEASEEVSFEVEDNADDAYRFVVVADSDWMNAPERAFPVVIDPQIVTEDSSLISKQVQTRTIYCGIGLIHQERSMSITRNRTAR